MRLGNRPASNSPRRATELPSAFRVVMTDFIIIGRIERVETIAVNHGIRDLRRLINQYGEGRWLKRKGLARIAYPDGSMERAEIHWYEAHGIGRKEFKNKRTLYLLS